MSKITPITPNFAVAGVLRPEDFAAIRAMGFAAVISNLPDGEFAAYPTAAQEAQLAEAAGLRSGTSRPPSSTCSPSAWSAACSRP